MQTSNTRAVLLMLALALSGCATTYDSSDLNPSSGQFGTLEHVDPVHSGVMIEKVDGKRHGIRPADLYRFTPGEHSLTARANVAFNASSSAVRWFDVEPGGRYAIQTYVDAGQWGFWIINKKTGLRVDREWSTHSH
jgi:hypothetical protein